MLGRPPEWPVSLAGESCFVLWFDTQLSPETEFSISIEGIETSAQPVHINEINYKKGTIWNNEILEPNA